MNEDRSLEMDAATAHLDRGWDLLHRGDLAAARLSAHQLLQLDAESAEGHTLLGAIAAAEGEAEEAVELLRQAMDLDPENLEAILHAAELAVHPLGDTALALQLCDQAEELTADAEEELDVALLRTEALLAAGRLEEARSAAGRLPPPPYPAPAYYLRAGRVQLDLVEVKAAAALLAQALEHPDTRADAHYFLAVAEEMLGRGGEALEHFLAVRELDRAAPEPAWGLSAEDFAAVAHEAVSKLPPELARVLAGVPLRVLDHPAAELVAEGFDPRATVYLSTRPLAQELQPRKKRRRGAPERQPGCVFIYKRTVERFARSSDGVAEELQAALEGEVASFVGDADTRPAGGA